MDRKKAMKNYNFVDYEMMTRILGRKIKEKRMEKEWSRNMLATYSKTDRNLILRIEGAQSKNGATIINLIRVAAALDLPLQELFKEVDEYCRYGVYNVQTNNEH